MSLNRRPKVLGVTPDGVRILEPAAGPGRFTVEEIRAAIAKLRAR